MRVAIFFLTVALLPFASSLRRPNIVVVLADDLDVMLGGLTPLTKTENLLAKVGITFANAFATTPLCCPSRASILTGSYIHSHGTLNNSLSGGCCDSEWRTRHEDNTFATVLHDAGYRTFYSGKYLNTYGMTKSGGVEHVPPGWDWWVGLVGNSVYYNYTLSVNGTEVRKGDEESDYLTDVLKNYSLEFLKDSREEPFLMVVAPPAPHEPFTPARRHKGRFATAKAPRTPNFNLPTNKTKHWLLSLPPDVLPPETIERVDEVFRNRWETLLAVDDLIEALVSQLRHMSALHNTYIIFTSDHGFHMGQFALPWDKRQPYETDIRIPLWVRGPNIFRRTSKAPVLNIDLAATILDMAGLPLRRFGDGVSFLSQVNSPLDEHPSRSFLVEYHGEGGYSENECNHDPNVKLCTLRASCKCFDSRNNTFVCLRRLSNTLDDIFCSFNDDRAFREFYDLRKDPYQLNNLAGVLETPHRVLDCCKKMRSYQKAVDECFEETQIKAEPRFAAKDTLPTFHSSRLLLLDPGSK